MCKDCLACSLNSLSSLTSFLYYCSTLHSHRLRTGSEAIGPHGYYLPITLTWWESIAEGPAWQYLVQHAYTLAERFSIPPQDLVMSTLLWRVLARWLMRACNSPREDAHSDHRKPSVSP